MKKSHFKIWLRAGLFVQFCGIFSFYLFRDISNGYFGWGWACLVIVLCVPIGFLMSRLVPMQVDVGVRAITLSVDRVYLVLIWLLVIAKLVAGRNPPFVHIADISMCIILGIMSGRLGGIGIRVRRLKNKHGFVE